MNEKSTFEEALKANPDKWPFTDHVRGLSTSIIREILKISSQPGVISLAGGYPSPDMFPIEDLKESAVAIIDEFKSVALQYSFSMGIPQFREVIAERETNLGAKSRMENILITSGSQQGIELLARAFVNPGDYIVTENPTYVGALQAFNYYKPRYAPVEMDHDGMLVDQVEDAIRKYKPKFIYTVSTFQNPTGITMTTERKKALIDIAVRNNIPIVDDNPYGELRFYGENLPTMKSLGGDAVISLGTFSKIVAPGFRIGWMNAPVSILSMFEKIKQGCDLHTSTFSQFVLYHFIKSGKLSAHIPKIIKSYRAKRDLMIHALEKHFPPGITWTKPEGGLFLWCELPLSMSASELLQEAIKEKVTYVYGRPFFPDGKKGDNTFRLNFSNASHEMLSSAIERLGRVFKANMP
nr:PLP-dependent aminotransferase family protein [candidate division Zixibacteria bacterium]